MYSSDTSIPSLYVPNGFPNGLILITNAAVVGKGGAGGENHGGFSSPGNPGYGGGTGVLLQAPVTLYNYGYLAGGGGGGGAAGSPSNQASYFVESGGGGGGAGYGAGGPSGAYAWGSAGDLTNGGAGGVGYAGKLGGNGGYLGTVGNYGETGENSGGPGGAGGAAGAAILGAAYILGGSIVGSTYGFVG